MDNNSFGMLIVLIVLAIAGRLAFYLAFKANKSKANAEQVNIQATGESIKRAIEEAAIVNKLVLGKLEILETRVAGIEKTLNDIPS